MRLSRWLPRVNVEPHLEREDLTLSPKHRRVFCVRRLLTFRNPTCWVGGVNGRVGWIADLRRPCGERLGLAESRPPDRNERFLSTVAKQGGAEWQDRTTPGRFKLGSLCEAISAGKHRNPSAGWHRNRVADTRRKQAGWVYR